MIPRYLFGRLHGFEIGSLWKHKPLCKYAFIDVDVFCYIFNQTLETLTLTKTKRRVNKTGGTICFFYRAAENDVHVCVRSRRKFWTTNLKYCGLLF
jgi:hypothetical protein